MFAQQLIDDQTAAAGELQRLASGQPNGWPTQLDEKQREASDELARQQGRDFDDKYLEAMADGLRDLAATLESRLDVRSLAEWKTAAAARTQGRAMPEPDAAMRDVQVRPGKSDGEMAAKINQWAAEAYPVTQKHLDTVTRLQRAADSGSLP